ncbi:MAG: hypothetical protein Q8K54_05440 [Gallionella sp.]|nr:hypothetical protein [Gallionella sp.]
MKTKKLDKVEEVAAPKVAVAAKPLRKSAATAAPAIKKAVPAPAVKEAKVAKEPKLAKEAKAVKKPKLKVVRDSFTMPQIEYQKIAEIKELCLKAGLPVKKSEVLRAGLQVLSAMAEAQMLNTLNGLDKIKTGRPNKH